jgi:nicotinamide mononucleotide transporter
VAYFESDFVRGGVSDRPPAPTGANQTNKKGVPMNLASLRSRDVAVGTVATLALSIPAFLGLLPFSMVEVAGFVTGGICVWLLVRENVWNWPIGIVNSGLYFVVFLHARLFADGALQLAFVALGAGGWWYWLCGGSSRSRLAIGRVKLPEALAVAAATVLATYGLTLYLESVGDAAPALDSLTTCLSLAATYLQARKFIENWLVWIAADVIYIPLYAWKQLPLTAGLYALFLGMSIRGLLAWRSSMHSEPSQRKAAFGPALELSQP